MPPRSRLSHRPSPRRGIVIAPADPATAAHGLAAGTVLEPSCIVSELHRAAAAAATTRHQASSVLACPDLSKPYMSTMNSKTQPFLTLSPPPLIGLRVVAAEANSDHEAKPSTRLAPRYAALAHLRSLASTTRSCLHHLVSPGPRARGRRSC